MSVVSQPESSAQAAAIARLIDHTLLKPEATPAAIERLCAEAVQYRFASVCVNPVYVPLCADLLRGQTEVVVGATVGFPLGAASPAVKRFEAEQALADGAAELDMVLHVGALKADDRAAVERDIAGVVAVAHAHGALVKVILETALLNDDEKIAACQIAQAAGADFVKTSTGFGPGGATVADVALMRRTVGAGMGVKASGGIRSYAEAQQMIAAGANRIGTSAGVRIVAEALGQGGEGDGAGRGVY